MCCDGYESWDYYSMWNNSDIKKITNWMTPFLWRSGTDEFLEGKIRLGLSALRARGHRWWLLNQHWYCIWGWWKCLELCRSYGCYNVVNASKITEAGEMAPWVRALATKSDNLTSILETRGIERDNWFPTVVLWLPHVHHGMHAHTYMHIQKTCIHK